MIDIISLLSTDGYIVCNKALIKELGADCAILVGELCAEYNYYKSTGELTSEDTFYSTQANIEFNTGLNEYAQRKALKKLQEEGIIQVTKKGIPAKNYYLICQDKLLNFFSTSALNFKALDLENLKINNNKKTNKENNNTLSKDKVTKSSTTKKLSLYDKCMLAIDEFTDNQELKLILTQYLNLRLEIKDKKMYSNQWKGMLAKLSQMTNQIDVVKQSIENGWASFYPLKSNNYKQKDVFSEGGKVHSVQNTDNLDEVKQNLKQKGKQVEF